MASAGEHEWLFKKDTSAAAGRNERDGEGGEDDDETDENSTAESEITRSNIVTFACLVVATFISWLAFAIMGPFFPREAHQRGVSDIEVGLLFALQSLTTVIMSPLVGKFIPMIGGKVTLVGGLVIETIGNIFFGFCAKLHSRTAFLVFTFLFRALIGVGVSTSVTATMAINANTFPNHFARTVGILEMTAGLGMLLSPLIGGALYEAGGSSFLLPFVVVGALDFASMLTSLIFLPRTRERSEESGSIMEVLRIPSVWPAIMAGFVGAFTLSFLEPTLSIHAAFLTSNTFYIGLLFMLASAVYAGSSPLWGYVGDTFGISRQCMVVGLFLETLSLLLLGPSPLLHLPKELWLLCISLILFGLSDGAIVVSSFSVLYLSAIEHGLSEDMKTHGVVSGIFNCVLCLGSMCGAWIAGGMLEQAVGFSATATITAGVVLVAALVTSSYYLVETTWQTRRDRRGRKLQDLRLIKTSNPVPETTPLFQQPDR
ncbi:MFS-type transporter SLC18B1-like [Diadema setosum]|uniref:MFS-type transporter SLC18B1-like n=1 Tax=Diadema setosum TaxID=31175 RepID=UPI003B3B1CCB